MLGQGKKGKTASAKVDTIIGQQTRIQGDLHFSGGLHIDGRVCGNVIAEGDGNSVLTVSEHGNIEGNVQVPNVILNGTVTGNVRSDERIELAAKARVNGDVHYKLIEMAMGAEVNGSLVPQQESSPSVVSFERDQSGSSNVPD
ncbi:MAG: polymer-forming cytoskeletal protein [Halobacteria archaeon]|nr:polymer-forming cytoskeletal protein [Halobacteria archaeon]